jgi:hypothetical protein
MLNCAKLKTYLVAVALGLGLTGAVPATCQAGSAKVENYSNSSIFVAVAYRTYKGTSDLAVEGWYEIRPNQSQTFSAADEDDMHLRIIGNGGREISFPKHQQFLSWPVVNQRFTVSKEPDDPTIRVLRWGASLENVRNVNRQGGALPPGWSNQRFFRIGSQNTRLEVRP